MLYSPSPYRALILGASGGIGAALTGALKNDPLCEHVTELSRSKDGADLTDNGALEKIAQQLKGSGEVFDLIINASGVLEIDGCGPEKAFRDIDPAVMARAFEINSIGAALALKHFAPFLRKDGKSAFATLSAKVGSIGDNRLGGWVSYRASKAALNQIVRCAAIEIGRTKKNAVIVALHPGTIKTPLTEKYAKGRYTASAEACAQNLLCVLSVLTAENSGGFFDYTGKEITW